MTMAVVLAAPGALLIAIVGLAAILAFYHRQRKRNSLRHQQSVALAAVGSVQPLPGEIQDDEDFNRRPQLTNSAKNATNGKQPDIIKSKRGRPIPLTNHLFSDQFMINSTSVHLNPFFPKFRIKRFRLSSKPQPDSIREL